MNNPSIPKKGINAKKKGNHGEHEFAHWLISHGFKAFRNSMSGGSVWKGDIANDLDCTFEIKTVKTINLKKAYAQVSRDASIAHNSPVLAIRFDHMPPRNWLIVLNSEDWIELIKQAKCTSEKNQSHLIQKSSLQVRLPKETKKLE